jgi:hypothetical protein
MTIVVNLYAGPGAGKSTPALRLTYDLKLAGLTTEYVYEFVKDAAWWGHTDVFDQPDYCFAQQHRLLRSVVGKCEIAVCDSPINLPVVYASQRPYDKYCPFDEYSALVNKVYKSYNNVNLFIDRGSLPYSHLGRNEDVDQAKVIDELITTHLISQNIKYIKFDPSNKFQYDTILRYLLKQKKAHENSINSTN